MSSWNLLGKCYEKIPLLGSADLWGDYPYRIRVDPRSAIGALPAARLRALVGEARQYSFDFLAWKRAFVLKKQWLVHAKRTCPRGHGALVKEVLGASQRRSFYCTQCQVLYADD